MHYACENWFKKSCIFKIYVDDVIITRAKCLLTDDEKELICKFEMKDHGELQYFCGWKL